MGVSVVVMVDEARGWRMFGERAIYEGPEVWLGEVDVALPDGERLWQHVVRLSRTALVVLVDERDRVLLVWRHRFVQDRWGWELPGGLADTGEAAVDAVARELEDQTGYRAGSLEHLVTFQAAAEQADTEHVVFTGRGAERAGEAVDRSGIERAEWVPLGSVLGLIAAGQIWNAGSMVGLLHVLAQRSSSE